MVTPAFHPVLNETEEVSVDLITGFKYKSALVSKVPICCSLQHQFVVFGNVLH